jgi:trimeric autotransporter adhesin
MKPSPISVAMFMVSLLLAPALLAQSPDSTNQSAASPASSASTAEVPRLIKFSGTLLDAQDRPMAGPVGVTFALYSQQTGGAALWLETQNVTPDANGVYTVLLGANSANGVPAELFASGEARWLEVQVERQTEQPRV